MMMQILVAMLMLNAGIVAIGLWRKRNMWPWIVCYWIVLTVKNALDFYMSTGNG